MTNTTFFKKGNIGTYAILSILIIIGIFVFGFISIAGYGMFKDIKDEVYIELEYNVSKTNLQESYDRFPSMLDGAFIFLFLGLVIASVASAFMSDNSPIFFVFMLLFNVSLIIISLFLGDVFEEFMTDITMTTAAGEFAATSFIMGNMLTMSIMITFFMLIAYFAKRNL